jgi:hypothetical protein
MSLKDCIPKQNQNIYRCAVFLHRMCHLVVFVFSAFSCEEASLAHVEVEALQASISEALKVESCLRQTKSF